MNESAFLKSRQRRATPVPAIVDIVNDALPLWLRPEILNRIRAAWRLANGVVDLVVITLFPIDAVLGKDGAPQRLRDMAMLFAIADLQLLDSYSLD